MRIKTAKTKPVKFFVTEDDAAQMKRLAELSDADNVSQFLRSLVRTLAVTEGPFRVADVVVKRRNA